MAMQKIQIADKPTLDEVATDVETLKELVADKPTLDTIKAEIEELKTTLASVSEIVTGLAESGSGSISIEQGKYSNTGGTTKKLSFNGKGKFLLYTDSNPTYLKPKIDGTQCNYHEPFVKAIGSSKWYIEIPFNNSLEVTVYGATSEWIVLKE